MIVTMLNSGIAYLARQNQNQERVMISHFAIGAGANYPLSTSQSNMLSNVELYRAKVDAFKVEGDNMTFTCVIPPTGTYTFGELALIAPDGTYVGMVVLTTPLVKNAGSQITLTLELAFLGLGYQATYVSGRTMLSYTRPDFDDAVTQLTAAALSTNTFKGLVASDTGSAIIDLMAGVVDFDSAMFESAYQECFPDMAKLTSSQYAIQTMLNNRLTRKLPASGYVTLTRLTTTAEQTIPAYTQFSSNGVNFFNRTSITFGVGVPQVNLLLYVGLVNTLLVTGQGTDYQFFNAVDSGFQVSNVDVLVTINGSAIPVVQDQLWNYIGKPAVQDFTDKSGSLVLSFGNSTIASRPPLGSTIGILYVTTNGVQGNNAGFANSKVVCSSLNNVVGIFNTGLSGGGDEPPVALYQRIGGDLFGASKGAVTSNQYSAIVLQYPGVIDATVLAQRDLAPFDKNWFNVAKVVLLTSSVWTQSDIDAFTLWYQARTMYAMRYVVSVGLAGSEPRPKAIPVTAVLYCFPETDLVAVQSAAASAVQRLFSPTAGTLGRNIYQTDITDAITAVAPNQIDYVVMTAPASDQVMNISAPLLQAVVSTSGGSLTAGTYTYGISSYDADGETATTQITVTVVAPNSKVTLTWSPTPASLGYRLYGRAGVILQMYAVVSTDAASYTFIDTGALTGAQTLPMPISTSGVHYATLGATSVTAKFTSRRVRGQ